MAREGPPGAALPASGTQVFTPGADGAEVRTFEAPMVSAPNQRKFTRVPVSFRVKVMAEEGVIASPMALNLSLKGVLVQTKHRLPLGTDAMVILFVMKEGVEKKILTWAKVVRHDPEGLGLSFTRIHGEESYQLLRSLVLALSDDPERVLEEFDAGEGAPERSH